MGDGAIVDLFWARDPSALTVAQDQYGNTCRTLAAQLLGSPEDAEECLNDALHRLWDTIPPKRPESLLGYLRKIVRNLAIDRWRGQTAARRGGGLQDLALELEECCTGLPRVPSAEDVLEAKELGKVLERWLDSLSKEDRILFVRRYWYGDGLDALAKQRGQTANALSQKLYRLRGRLRKYLEREGIAI